MNATSPQNQPNSFDRCNPTLMRGDLAAINELARLALKMERASVALIDSDPSVDVDAVIGADASRMVAAAFAANARHRTTFSIWQLLTATSDHICAAIAESGEFKTRIRKADIPNRWILLASGLALNARSLIAEHSPRPTLSRQKRPHAAPNGPRSYSPINQPTKMPPRPRKVAPRGRLFPRRTPFR